MSFPLRLLHQLRKNATNVFCVPAPLQVGGFGRVYEAVWRGQRVAVKTVRCDSEAQRSALRKEVELCAKLR